MKFCHLNRVTTKMGLFCLALGMTLGMGFGPLAVVQAQDTKAVEKRLTEAVSKGELSLRQAAAMLEALERSSQARQWSKDAPGSKEGPGIGGEYRGHHGAWHRGHQMHHRPTGGPGGRPTWGRPPQRDGEKPEVSKSDSPRSAEKKPDGNQGSRGDQSGRADARAQYPYAQARLMAAVKSGDMTPEEARQKLREVMGRSEADGKEVSVDRRRMFYQHAEAAMKKMVADKKITEEEAKDRLTSLRKRLMSEQEKADSSTKDKSDKNEDSKTEKKAEPKAEPKSEPKRSDRDQPSRSRSRN